jgi:hypothetical protein
LILSGPVDTMKGSDTVGLEGANELRTGIHFGRGADASWRRVDPLSTPDERDAPLGRGRGIIETLGCLRRERGQGEVVEWGSFLSPFSAG